MYTLDRRYVGVFIDFVSLIYAVFFLPETVEFTLERRKVRRGFGIANPAVNGSFSLLFSLLASLNQNLLQDADAGAFSLYFSTLENSGQRSPNQDSSALSFSAVTRRPIAGGGEAGSELLDHHRADLRVLQQVPLLHLRYGGLPVRHAEAPHDRSGVHATQRHGQRLQLLPNWRSLLLALQHAPVQRALHRRRRRPPGQYALLPSLTRSTRLRALDLRQPRDVRRGKHPPSAGLRLLRPNHPHDFVGTCAGRRQR